jgi:hypothetical protein
MRHGSLRCSRGVRLGTERAFSNARQRGEDRKVGGSLINVVCDFDGAASAQAVRAEEGRRRLRVIARAQVRAGTFVSDSEALTVGAAADAWIEQCRLRRHTGRRMERATGRDYEDKVRLHIKHPETGIAHLKLSRLTRKAVNEFRDRMLAAGRSDHLTRRTLSVLKLLLNHAIDNGQLHINPAQGVRVIRTSRIQYKVPVPSKEIVRKLIDAAADDSFKPMLIVSALCGLRASELRGLRWPMSTTRTVSSACASVPIFTRRLATQNRQRGCAMCLPGRWC